MLLKEARKVHKLTMGSLNSADAVAKVKFQISSCLRVSGIVVAHNPHAAASPCCICLAECEHLDSLLLI